MLKVKSLLDYTNLFSPNKNQKNGKNNTKLFSIRLRWIKFISLFVESIKNLKTRNYHTFLKKQYFFLLSAVSETMRMKKYLDKENQLRY